MRYFEKNRRTLIKNHYVCGTAKSISGNDSVELLSSSGAPIKRLKISGNTLQDGTTTPDAPIDNANSNGMTVALHSTNLATAQQVYKGYQAYLETTYDGRNVIRFRNGNATEFIIDGGFKENTQYTISGWYDSSVASGTGDGVYIINVTYTDGTREYKFIGSPTTWTKVVFTTQAGKTIQYIGSRPNGYQTNGYVDIDTFKINEGTEELPYEPYFREEISIPQVVQADEGEVSLLLSERDSLMVDRVHKQVVYKEGSAETEGSFIEHDLSCTELGQALLSLCVPRGENGTLEVSGAVGDIPIELTYYSTEDADMVNITIRYLNSEGKEIAEPKIHNVRQGSKYLIVAPHIDGYTRVSSEVYGVADDDAEIILEYEEVE